MAEPISDETADASPPTNLHDFRTDPVWGNVWNPESNLWQPSNEPYPAYGQDAAVVEYQSHADVMTATPISEMYGTPDPYGTGTTPDPRLNLLTDKQQVGPAAPPVHIVKQETVTRETGADVIRARTVAVVGNLVPTRLLDENPNRSRALVKVVTTNSVVLIGPPFGGMGAPQLSATPTQPGAQWWQATGDPLFKIESCAAVDAIGVIAPPGVVLVSVWEELNNPGHTPGVGL
jgi:hypothetical protein